MEICVDFDGTCLTHQFPELGKDIGAIPVLKRLTNAGHRLILFTMRSDGQIEQKMDNGHQMYGGDFLTQAVNWFKDNDIPLYGVQRNPTQDKWTSSPKAYGQMYIDDAALGVPLIRPEGERPYVDWVKVEELLEEQGLI